MPCESAPAALSRKNGTNESDVLMSFGILRDALFRARADLLADCHLVGVGHLDVFEF